MGTLALIEILDRDGSVRHSQKVDAWPLRVGRSLDNDLVLDDPHVAAHHFSVDANEDGVFLAVGDTVNGVAVGPQRLAAGERWQAASAPSTVVVGRTQLRLRLAEHTLPAERPLVRARALNHGLGSLVVLLLVNVAVMAGHTYLTTDPEPLAETLTTNLLAGLLLLGVWCGGWTLLSKLFTRQAHFPWHLRVALSAGLAWAGLDFLLSAVAFAASWPVFTAYKYAVEMLVLAGALYLHAQAVETHRPLFTRSFAVATFVIGMGLSAWGHWQRNETLRGELYMADLFPPAARFAAPQSTDAFVDGLKALEPVLDAKARKPGKDDANDSNLEDD